MFEPRVVYGANGRQFGRYHNNMAASEPNFFASRDELESFADYANASTRRRGTCNNIFGPFVRRRPVLPKGDA